MTTNAARRLGAEEVRFHPDLAALGIDSSADLSPSPTTVGQPEALAALELGVTMRRPGYNVFVAGSTGTGRFAAVKMIIEAKSVECPITPSYSYVYNFDDPDRPVLVTLPRGQGKELQTRLETLRGELSELIPAVLGSEVLQQARERLQADFTGRTQGLFEAFDEKVREQGFQLVQGTDPATQVQVTDIFPVVDGEPVPLQRLAPGQTPEEEQERERLLALHGELHEELQRLMLEHRTLRGAFQKALQELQRQHVREVLEPHFQELEAPFRAHDENIHVFLERALKEILEHLQLFQETASDGNADQTQTRMTTENLLWVLRSNLLIEGGDPEHPPKGPPVIEETYPTYRNLFGTIETGGEPSSTTFMDVKAGSLLHANGGYIVLSARDVMSEPKVYDTLKRTLRKEALEITPKDEGVAAALGLKPSPIPVDVKVVLVGEPYVYEVLNAADPDFRKIFKVKAEFDDRMRRTDATLKSFLSVVRRIQDRDDLPDFDRGALELLLAEGVRMSGNRRMLTTCFSDIADLMREAAHVARRRQVDLVEAGDTRAAIEGRYTRHNLAERRIHDMIERGMLLTCVEGSDVGRINGLAYYSVDNADFGTPARISATTAIGRAGVVNIEREAELSGSIHDKGVLLLSGFLAQTFAQDKPLCLRANIAFEQSYATIDGDSASLAELVAILSSLSGHPLRQDLAMTGSLNQRGEVQPVGGVTQKVEGFWHACSIKGLSGTQGVVLPEQNVEDLHLRRSLAELVKEGRFTIFAVTEFRQALELMTGRPAQETLDAADAKLAAYAEVVHKRGGLGAESG